MGRRKRSVDNDFSSQPVIKKRRGSRNISTVSVTDLELQILELKKRLRNSDHELSRERLARKEAEIELDGVKQEKDLLQTRWDTERREVLKRAKFIEEKEKKAKEELKKTLEIGTQSENDYEKKINNLKIQNNGLKQKLLGLQTKNKRLASHFEIEKMELVDDNNSKQNLIDYFKHQQEKSKKQELKYREETEERIKTLGNKIATLQEQIKMKRQNEMASKYEVDAIEITQLKRRNRQLNAEVKNIKHDREQIWLLSDEASKYQGLYENMKEKCLELARAEEEIPLLKEENDQWKRLISSQFPECKDVFEVEVRLQEILNSSTENYKAKSLLESEMEIINQNYSSLKISHKKVTEELSNVKKELTLKTAHVKDYDWQLGYLRDTNVRYHKMLTEFETINGIVLHEKRLKTLEKENDVSCRKIQQLAKTKCELEDQKLKLEIKVEQLQKKLEAQIQRNASKRSQPINSENVC